MDKYDSGRPTRRSLRQRGTADTARVAAREPGSGLVTVYDYEHAARFVKSRVFVTPSVDQRPPAHLSWLPRPVWAKPREMASHLKLIWIAVRHRHDDLILVKGFSTTMFAVVAPFVWHARQRMLLTMHHNLQFAHRRPLEAWILRLLCRAGFRFAVLDAMDGVAELGIEPDARQFFVLHPPIPEPESIAASPQRAARPAGGVGVIGSFRGEKNTEDLLQFLVEARDRGQLDTRIVLGCPNDVLLQKWRAARVDGINTADYRDYLAALASCEVVVVNYQSAQYYYRSSGVIGDALALGAAVACPDYPVFRRQITEPVTVGAVFRGVEDLVPAIHTALELRRSKPENLEIWRRARSPHGFSRRLDGFILATRSR